MSLIDRIAAAKERQPEPVKRPAFEPEWVKRAKEQKLPPKEYR